MEKPAGLYSHYFEAYAASKVYALHATESFLAANQPPFDVINSMPSVLIGKLVLTTDQRIPQMARKGRHGSFVRKQESVP